MLLFCTAVSQVVDKLEWIFVCNKEEKYMQDTCVGKPPHNKEMGCIFAYTEKLI